MHVLIVFVSCLSMGLWSLCYSWEIGGLIVYTIGCVSGYTTSIALYVSFHGSIVDSAGGC